MPGPEKFGPAETCRKVFLRGRFTFVRAAVFIAAESVISLPL